MNVAVRGGAAMTARAPAVVQVTFDGLRREQLDYRWIEEIGGVEAYVFDGRELVGGQPWRCLRDNLRLVRELGTDVLTMHFPTDHADWVNDKAEYDKLRKFCDLAAECGAEGVVLHSNQFVAIDDWPAFDLNGARTKVLASLARLDEYLSGSPIWIGIENMPMVGGSGENFDSVFVVPADFSPLLELNSTRIGVTWDVCHWAITCSILRAITHLRREPSVAEPLELPSVPMRHIHFSSFSGHAMPYWRGQFSEGAVPPEGEFEEDQLARMLEQAIGHATLDASVVFEVQEDDYEDRRNCWRTLDWVTSMPCLDGLVRTRRRQ